MARSRRRENLFKLWDNRHKILQSKVDGALLETSILKSGTKFLQKVGVNSRDPLGDPRFYFSNETSFAGYRPTHPFL